MRFCKLKASSVVHSTFLKISLKMALQIGPKHVTGIIIQYNLITYKVVSDCVIHILAYIQHNGDVSLEKKSHIVPFDLFCSHCRSSYLRGIRFLQMCPVSERSLNKANQCRHSDKAAKTMKPQEETTSEILVADTDSELGAEASDSDDKFQKEEEQQ